MNTCTSRWKKTLAARGLACISRSTSSPLSPTSTEAVSALLFATARQVAADQHLLEPAADLVERRTAFRDELRAVLRDMDMVEKISLQQFRVREMERRALREAAD